MKTTEFLHTLSEPMPDWLKSLKPGEPASINQFFGSRLVYYPGSGHDGQPVALFGASHAAHCFVYADYGVSRSEVERDLNSRSDSFSGYRTLDRIQISENDLTPQRWMPHIQPDEIADKKFAAGFVAPFGFLEILERFESLNDDHGPQRLAILFLGADGIAAYDALFCQNAYAAPFAVVIQEHGFGGNYNAFGRGSLLELVASRTETWPAYLLVSANGQCWEGYKAMPNLESTRGGEHLTERALFERQS